MENNGVRPWDLFKKNSGRVSEEVSNFRYEICKVCPHFIKATTQCKKCGCIMSAKVKLSEADCPIGKWGKEKISFTEEIK